MASTATNTAAEQASEQAKAELYRRLANNDKAVRDRGVKMLRDFLAKRKNISEIGMMKIWKAVFYCFWMSDKVPVQMELAERLAGLVHVQNDANGILYMMCFWKTIAREWNGIDRLRLDKFMALVRHFVRQTFVLLHLKHWPSELVAAHLDALASVAINNGVAAGGSQGAAISAQTAPRGLLMHVADIYVDELVGSPAHAREQHSTDRKIPSEAFRQCLFPYYVVLSNYADAYVVDRVADRVFSRMMDKYIELAEDEQHGHAALDLFHEIAYSARLLFDLGAEPSTKGKARKLFYDLHQKFKSFLAEVDSEFEIPSTEEYEQQGADEEPVVVDEPKSAGNKKRKASQDQVASTQSSLETPSIKSAKPVEPTAAAPGSSKKKSKNSDSAASEPLVSVAPVPSSSSTPVVSLSAKKSNKKVLSVDSNASTSVESSELVTPKSSSSKSQPETPETPETPQTHKTVPGPTPMVRKHQIPASDDEDADGDQSIRRKSDVTSSGKKRVIFSLQSNKVQEFEKKKPIQVKESTDSILSKQSPRGVIKTTSAFKSSPVKSSSAAEENDIALHVTGGRTSTPKSSSKPKAAPTSTGGKAKKKASDYF